MTQEQLRALSTDELKDLLSQINSELKFRCSAKDLVLYSHDCIDQTRTHLSRCRHWAKLVTAVDTTKTNGFAFLGEFLSVTSVNKIPSGSVVVETCKNKIYGYLVDSSGKHLIDSSTSSNPVEFIDKISHFLMRKKCEK